MARLTPLLAAAIALAGVLASTLLLRGVALDAMDRLLEERLRGAGESAALLLGPEGIEEAVLQRLVEANALDGAYLVTESLEMIADTQGEAGGPADLLRVDATRVERAAAGEASVGPGYQLGALTVATGYFPLRAREGKPLVLGLEAGRSFLTARQRVQRAWFAALALGGIGALALGLLAQRFARTERERRKQAAKAARGEALERMAAMAAHEIRNPLGVIRGTVELMAERSRSSLTERDRESLADVLQEVERLRRLTDDFRALSSEPVLQLEATDVAALVREVARAVETEFESVRCEFDGPQALEAAVDAGRLRQVLLNLLRNAAQAQPEVHVRISLARRGAQLRLRIADDGPGIPSTVRPRLFEAFVTSRPGGTGLGLALSRRLVERHGGSLELLDSERGAVFEVRLPARRGG